ncbi:UPF0280 family protein [Arenibaculum pallidiluteum]|uniref:UPF0280 family protein n=1 Tax=Arenibaculum pallidiluteum TaxID=2812559 RepID=UPI001A9579AA|nr:UPF0280 family protein [Arenibaculum pallidiluteum]
MSGPVAARFPDGRLHLQHGPIDLVIGADGDPASVEQAHGAAIDRFQDILSVLVSELPLLRSPVQAAAPALRGPVARRMAAACLPFAPEFITPMAAVAGAVADEVMEAMRAAQTAGALLTRAYVNNGGDIALHLSPGASFAVGLVADLDRPAHDGTIAVTHDMPVRGLATSGWRGRSQSLGIADSVTALAGTGAAADAAATMIANAVRSDHAAVVRRPARAVKDDSDLGDLPVTVAVGTLPEDAVVSALDGGRAYAEDLLQRGLVHGAVLVLQGRVRVVGAPAGQLAGPARGFASGKELAWA